MKFAIVLLALVAAVCAQNEAFCRCGAFLTYNDDETMVYELPEIALDSCSDHDKCKKLCTKEIDEFTQYGDLWALTPEGKTVGQVICENLTGLSWDSVHNHLVYGYYEVCGGPWEYTGQSTQGLLCCNDGVHVHCVNY